MGGLHRHSSPPTPEIIPHIFQEEEDPVPLYFLDETGELSAGIESSPPPPPFQTSELCRMGNPLSSLRSLPSKKKNILKLKSAMRKQPPSSDPNAQFNASSSSSEYSGIMMNNDDTKNSSKLKKFVRFLDRVEIVPAPDSFYGVSPPASDSDPSSSSDDSSPRRKRKNKKQKHRHDRNPQNIPSPPSEPSEFYQMEFTSSPELDEGILSGLGRAGSPNRSPNRSPNGSCHNLASPPPEILYYDPTYLTPSAPSAPPLPPSPPPSWRIPPASLTGRQPHVREPPRVRSPIREDDEIDLRAHEAASSGVPTATRPGVSYVRPEVTRKTAEKQTFHPVIARKMWPHGEIRFEDQWGRRLIPVGHRDSFRFDLWPVEEDVVREQERGGSVRGAWVRGRDGRR